FCTKPGLIFGVGGPDSQQFATQFAPAIGGTPPATMLHAAVRAHTRAYTPLSRSVLYTPGIDLWRRRARFAAVRHAVCHGDWRHTPGHHAPCRHLRPICRALVR